MSNSIQDKFIKNTIYIVVGILAFCYIVVQPYNTYCRIKKNCDPVIFSNLINHKNGKKEIKINFVATIPEDLEDSLEFDVSQKDLTILNGKNIDNSYAVENLTDENITVGAHFDIEPKGAEKYLEKIECICFKNQPLDANAKASMPVKLRIDPKIEKDSEFENLKEITVNYTAYLVN